MAEIQHTKIIKVSAFEIADILTRHFDVLGADVRFTVMSDPEDHSAYPTNVLSGAVITLDIAATQKEPPKPYYR